MSTFNKPFVEPIYVTRPILPDIAKINEKLSNVWGSKWLTNNGPQHQLLEKELVHFLKVPHLSLFNNGTMALLVACRSLQLSGDVITTPFTFPATPHALSWNNIRPVFCDIDRYTMNIDADKIESMVTSQTTGILAVHIFGTPCDVGKIQNIADRYGLRVVYDAAHAFGVEINGKGIGNFGDVSMMSFHATKIFHTAEGGALITKDKNLKNRVNLLKNFGIQNEEEVVVPGINGKMSEIQAALGLIVLDSVEEEIEKRAILSERYRECLQGVKGISLLDNLPMVKNNHQYFVIKISENHFGCSRDQLHKKLKEYNIFTRKYFYPLCSQYSYYRQLPSSDLSNLPVANEVAREVLSMPLYGELSTGDIEKICSILRKIKKT